LVIPRLAAIAFGAVAERDNDVNGWGVPQQPDREPEVVLPRGLPSTATFFLAFVAVVLAGVFGGLIGFGLVRVGAHGDRTVPEVLGALVGAVLAAGGVGIVVVLVLRAMSEWQYRDAGRARPSRRS
jgi:uncharacterized membrane protein YccC